MAQGGKVPQPSLEAIRSSEWVANRTCNVPSVTLPSGEVVHQCKYYPIRYAQREKLLTPIEDQKTLFTLTGSQAWATFTFCNFMTLLL